jgi:hypothetical protein
VAAGMADEAGRACSAFADTYSLPSVDNHGQDICSVANKLSYKLRMK